MAADLDHNADSNNPDRLVNAAPTVTSVRNTSSPVAPNWYTTGETIEITVTFSIPITVAGDPVFRFALSSPGMTEERRPFSDLYGQRQRPQHHGVPVHGARHR